MSPSWRLSPGVRPDDAGPCHAAPGAKPPPAAAPASPTARPFSNRRRFESTGTSLPPDHDPTVFALSLALLAAVAFAAGYLPAARAARVDPTEVLRHE